MGRSTTRSVKTDKLAAEPELASVILRLMMAVNDISIANTTLEEWSNAEDPRKKVRQTGGKLYFGRMQMGHIYEALLIIKDICDKPSLRAYVDKCDSRTKESFAKLEAFLATNDYTILLRIRNNASFHYDGKLAVKYVTAIADQFPGHSTLYSLGTEQLDWYFNIADLIVDKIVVRDIFKIAATGDVRKEVDAILDRFHLMSWAFTDFAAYFIRHYL